MVMVLDIVNNLRMLQAMYEYKLLDAKDDVQLVQIKAAIKSLDEQIKFMNDVKAQLI